MSDQTVIDLYINDLASTTHQLYQEKGLNADLTKENADLKSAVESLTQNNTDLKFEITTLQQKYNDLKSGAGDTPIEGQVVQPATPPTPSSHF
jgi:uncharacterized protein YlxW (UPF0749 family)